MPAVLERKTYTYQDYLLMSDDKHYELICGELIMSPSPVPKHQRILRNLEDVLWHFISKNKLGELLFAPMDVYLDETNVVEPDILFISKEKEKIITEKNVQGVPDLLVEIISQGSIRRDMITKKSLYEKFGVQEYWLVFPDEEVVEIYQLKDMSYKLFRAFLKDEILESPLLKGLQFDLKEIF